MKYLLLLLSNLLPTLHRLPRLLQLLLLALRPIALRDGDLLLQVLDSFGDLVTERTEDGFCFLEGGLLLLRVRVIPTNLSGGQLKRIIYLLLQHVRGVAVEVGFSGGNLSLELGDAGFLMGELLVVVGLFFYEAEDRVGCSLEGGGGCHFG